MGAEAWFRNAESNQIARQKGGKRRATSPRRLTPAARAAWAA
ncbi:MAG: hypothetical protein QOF05_1132 [Sphingomonadales bacterium]|nr:hypothetical protein [Sphingomonadales bacterium]